MNNILLSRTPDIVETTLKVSSGNNPKLSKMPRKPNMGLRGFCIFCDQILNSTIKSDYRSNR